MTDSYVLTPTLENYLEVIFRISAEKGFARVRGISKALSVHKSTVTSALQSLSEKKLVNYTPYEVITLTSKGEKLAKEVAHRHEVLCSFLVAVLCVDRELAEENACRMEHVMDEEILDRLALFARFVKECPRAGKEWVENFSYFFKHRGKSKKDLAEIEHWIDDFKEKVGSFNPKGNRENMTTLDQLKPGQKGKILKIGSVGAIKQRIIDMGAVSGTPVEVIKVAPLGDPIEIKIKGYNLSLRKDEAGAITVEAE